MFSGENQHFYGQGPSSGARINGGHSAQPNEYIGGHSALPIEDTGVTCKGAHHCHSEKKCRPLFAPIGLSQCKKGKPGLLPPRPHHQPGPDDGLCQLTESGLLVWPKILFTGRLPFFLLLDESADKLIEKQRTWNCRHQASHGLVKKYAPAILHGCKHSRGQFEPMRK